MWSSSHLQIDSDFSELGLDLPQIELSEEAIKNLRDIQEMIFWDDVLGDLGTWEGQITQADVKELLDESYDAWLATPDLTLQMIADQAEWGHLPELVSKDLPFTYTEVKT
jgi:hypothetical protein